MRIQVLEDELKSHVDRVVCGPIVSVDKLHCVQEIVSDESDMKPYNTLQRLHYYLGHDDGSDVVQSYDPGLFGDGNDGGGFEAVWHMTSLQRGVGDICEHQRVLVSTMLQCGRGDRVWAGSFAGVLTAKQTPKC